MIYSGVKIAALKIKAIQKAKNKNNTFLKTAKLEKKHSHSHSHTHTHTHTHTLINKKKVGKNGGIPLFGGKWSCLQYKQVQLQWISCKVKDRQ